MAIGSRAALVVLAWTTACAAQDVSTQPANPPFARRTLPEYSAKLLMEDGTPPPAELHVLTIGQCSIRNVFANGTIVFTHDAGDTTDHSDNTRACVVWVAGPGIRSQSVTVRDGVQVALRKLGEREGSTISMTLLKAPPQARKAYTKGAEAANKKKYADARKHFEQALKIYPQYAMAWSELGAVLQKLGLIEDARSAYQQAASADKLYIKPLVQLAALEASRERWPECARAADAAIALNPIEFPGAYFHRAQAHLQAGEWDLAVKQSENAIRFDSGQEYGRAYFVLAAAFEKRGDVKAAAAAFEQYLSTRPPEDEAAKARASLSRLAQ